MATSFTNTSFTSIYNKLLLLKNNRQRYILSREIGEIYNQFLLLLVKRNKQFNKLNESLDSLDDKGNESLDSFNDKGNESLDSFNDKGELNDKGDELLGKNRESTGKNDKRVESGKNDDRKVDGVVHFGLVSDSSALRKSDSDVSRASDSAAMRRSDSDVSRASDSDALKSDSAVSRASDSDVLKKSDSDNVNGDIKDSDVLNVGNINDSAVLTNNIKSSHLLDNRAREIESGDAESGNNNNSGDKESGNNIDSGDSSLSNDSLDSLLDDIWQLLSLCFLTCGLINNAPATYSSLSAVHKLLDHLKELKIYTTKELIPIKLRLRDIKRIIEGNAVSDDSDLDLVENEWETGGGDSAGESDFGGNSTGESFAEASSAGVKIIVGDDSGDDTSLVDENDKAKSSSSIGGSISSQESTSGENIAPNTASSGIDTATLSQSESNIRSGDLGSNEGSFGLDFKSVTDTSIGSSIGANIIQSRLSNSAESLSDFKPQSSANSIHERGDINTIEESILRSKYNKIEKLYLSIASNLSNIPSSIKGNYNLLVNLRKRLINIITNDEKDDIAEIKEEFNRLKNFEKVDFTSLNYNAVLDGLIDDINNLVSVVSLNDFNLFKNSKEFYYINKLDTLYSKLFDTRLKLENLLITRRWTMRETDLYHYQKLLKTIDDERLKINDEIKKKRKGKDEESTDGNDLKLDKVQKGIESVEIGISDAESLYSNELSKSSTYLKRSSTSLSSVSESNVTPSQYLKRQQLLILYLLRRCYSLIYKLLESSEPVSESLTPIFNQLSTVKRCLLELKRVDGISNIRELFPFQMKLASLDNLRIDGKFIINGQIPEGQGTLNALLAESFDIIHELKIEMEEEDDDEEELTALTQTNDDVEVDVKRNRFKEFDNDNDLDNVSAFGEEDDEEFESEEYDDDDDYNNDYY